MSGASAEKSSGATDDLSAVVVAWNTRELLLACLASLEREAARAGLIDRKSVV